MVRLLIRFTFNIALVWFLAREFTQYFTLTGGWRGILILAALVTLTNLLVRPLLELLTFPLRLFLSLVASLLVNAACVAVLVAAARIIDPDLLAIRGVAGWVFTILVLAVGNWLVKMLTR